MISLFVIFHTDLIRYLSWHCVYLCPSHPHPPHIKSNSLYISTTCGFFGLRGHLAFFQFLIGFLTVSLDAIELEIHVLLIDEGIAHDIAPEVIVVFAIRSITDQHFAFFNHQLLSRHVDLAQSFEESVILRHGSHILRNIVIADVEGVSRVD